MIFDNTAPVVSAAGPDREPFAPGSTQTWTLRAEDAASGIAATACSVVPVGAPRVVVPCSGGGSHSVTGLPEGRYEFAFGARDAAGNYAETVRFFRIETPAAGASRPTVTSPPSPRPPTARPRPPRSPPRPARRPGRPQPRGSRSPSASATRP